MKNKCPVTGCDKTHPHIHTTVQILEAKLKASEEREKVLKLALQNIGTKKADMFTNGLSDVQTFMANKALAKAYPNEKEGHDEHKPS